MTTTPCWRVPVEFARLRPRSVQAHLLLAIALAATKGDPDMPTEQRLDLVESNYKKALEIDPNNAYAHAAYGSFLVTLDRNAEALAQSEMALRIDPERPSGVHQSTDVASLRPTRERH